VASVSIVDRADGTDPYEAARVLRVPDGRTGRQRGRKNLVPRLVTWSPGR
jgi:hypothetical protein